MTPAEQLARLAHLLTSTPIGGEWSPWLLAALEATVFLLGWLAWRTARRCGRRIRWTVGLLMFAVLVRGVEAGTPPPGPPLTPVLLVEGVAYVLALWFLAHRRRRDD